MIEVTLWRVVGTVLGFVIVNAIVIYFGIFRRQNTQGTEIYGLNIKNHNLSKLIENNKRETDEKIALIYENLNKRIEYVIKADIDEIKIKYEEIDRFLNRISEQKNNLEQAIELLEVLNNNSEQSDTIIQLNKRLSKLESQPIIKVGRIGLKHHKGFIQTEELQKGNGERDKKIEVEFNDKDKKFSSPPDVYVALAMVDGQYNGECEKFSLKFGCNTKVHVFAESVTEEKFTLKVRTWDSSKIWNIDAVWIAIGK